MLDFPKFYVHEEWYNIFKGSSWPDWEDFISMPDYDSLPINLKQEIIGVILNFPKYQKHCAPYLRYAFSDCELIEHSYSDSWQDMFVLTMLNGKKNGTFLEIGANMPVKQSGQPAGVGYNNTYLLETQFGFKGISIDIQDFSTDWMSCRSNGNFVQTDALMCDYDELCKKHKMSTNFDYLQVDVDPAINSLEALKKVLGSTLRFSVITYESNVDFENDRKLAEELRIQSQQLLENHGYTLLIPHVGLADSSKGWQEYEDWYIDETKISNEIIKKFSIFKNSNKTIPPYKIFINNEKTEIN